MLFSLMVYFTHASPENQGMFNYRTQHKLPSVLFHPAFPSDIMEPSNEGGKEP